MNKLKRYTLSIFNKISKFFGDRSLSFSFIGENGKLIAQSIFTILSIGIGIWFFNHQKTELVAINQLLRSAGWELVVLGLGLTLIYIVVQGYMYVASFATFRHKLPLLIGIKLFLKRNFISVFLPAGGVSSLAFFTSDIERRGISKLNIHFASTVYGFVGILSVVLVAVPAFAYAVAECWKRQGGIFLGILYGVFLKI